MASTGAVATTESVNWLKSDERDAYGDERAEFNICEARTRHMLRTWYGELVMAMNAASNQPRTR